METVKTNSIDSRNNALDFLKGICILFVIFTHYGWDEHTWHKMLFPFWIDMAVPIFMVISGFVNTMSFEKKNYVHLEDAYSWQNLLVKYIRFTIPFLITCIVQLFLLLSTHNFDLFKSTTIFFQGGYGPGSYYYPILIQFIFVFPIIEFIIKRYNFNGFILCLIINLFFEFFQRIYFVDEELYRLLIFRYISVIAWGALLFFRKNIFQKWYLHLIPFFIGLGFIYLVEYTNYSPVIINKWSRTSCLATLYVLPICTFFFNTKWGKRCLFIEQLGKASFNIFLVQMTYYQFIVGYIYNFTEIVSIRLILNFSICIGMGLIFYFFENKITKKIINMVTK